MSDRRRRSEQAQAPQLGRGKTFRLIGVVAFILFGIGFFALRTYFGSARFQRDVDRMLRPQLARRGILFDTVDVSPLGKIKITNLKIRLKDGSELVIPEVEGFTEYSALMQGEARVTLDVTKLAQQFFEKKSVGVKIAQESKILYVSLASTLAKLGSEENLRGEVQLEGVKVDIKPPNGDEFPLHFHDGKLSLIQQVLTSRGLKFSLPPMQGLSLGTVESGDLMMTFDGNIRNVFTKPEFFDAKIKTEVRTEPAWDRTLTYLALPEVRRKVDWLGPVSLEANLAGAVDSPDVKGMLRAKDLHQRMRGEYRQIDLYYSSLEGPIERKPDGSTVMHLKGGPLRGEYHRHKDSTLKKLRVHVDGLETKVVIKNKLLFLEDLKFAAYGGVAFGQLKWDLSVKKIPLRDTFGRSNEVFYGDSAYDYRLGFRNIDLGSFLKDVTSLDRPFEGKFTGLMKGEGKSLMLERMHGDGRVKVENFRVGNPPLSGTYVKLFPRTAQGEIPGIPLGNFQTTWNFKNGGLHFPDLSSESPEASLRGVLDYDILSLEISGQLRLGILERALAKRQFLRGALGGPRTIVVGLGGRVVQPEISYSVGGTPSP